MDLYGKEQYEELDFVTKAVEPYVFKYETELNAMPDKYVFTYQDVVNLSSKDDKITDVSQNRLLEYIFAKFGIENPGEDLIKKFSLDVLPGTELNVGTGELTGEISLVKVAQAFEEKEIIGIIADTFEYHCDVDRRTLKIGGIEKLNDVLRAFNIQDGLSSSSTRTKYHCIRSAITNRINQKRLLIKDQELAKNLGQWVSSYIKTGHPDDLRRLCKISLMETTGVPIYKVEI